MFHIKYTTILIKTLKKTIFQIFIIKENNKRNLKTFLDI